MCHGTVQLAVTEDEDEDEDRRGLNQRGSWTHRWGRGFITSGVSRFLQGNAVLRLWLSMQV